MRKEQNAHHALTKVKYDHVQRLIHELRARKLKEIKPCSRTGNAKGDFRGFGTGERQKRMGEK